MGRFPVNLYLVITDEQDYEDQIRHLPPLGKSDRLLSRCGFFVRWPYLSPQARIARSFKRTNLDFMKVFPWYTLDVVDDGLPLDTMAG